MEVSALKYSGGIGLHGRSPLLRLQSDERLVVLVRRGNMSAFEVLVGRYETRLLAFCRHLLGSREDAEDVLQEVLASAYNAMVADERPINVRPWLYRIARNRSLNHLRRVQAIGVDSMDIHLSDHGATTADKVGEREEFRLLVGDIQGLPESQRTALVLREMDALSYEQIAEAMDTTVPSVKSLLVRARVSLAEAAEARLLTCDEVRHELGEVAEGLLRKPSAPVRRHVKSCQRCQTFESQMKRTNKALAALLPIGPFVFLRKLAIFHLGHSAGAHAAGSGIGAGSAGATAGSGAATAGAATAGAASTTAAATAVATSSSGLVSAGVGALATKAAAGLAAAAIVTAGAVEVGHHAHRALSPAQIAARQAAAAGTVQQGLAAASHQAPIVAPIVTVPAPRAGQAAVATTVRRHRRERTSRTHRRRLVPASRTRVTTIAAATFTTATPVTTAATTTAATTAATTPATPATTDATTTSTGTTATTTDTGRTAVTVAPTVLPPADAGTPAAAATPAVPTLTPTTTTSTTPAAAPTTTTPTTTTPATTTPTTTTPTTTTPTTTTPTTTTPTTTTPTTTTPTTTTPTTTTPTTTTPANTATTGTTTQASGTPTPQAVGGGS